jgi:hypothetical protein
MVPTTSWSRCSPPQPGWESWLGFSRTGRRGVPRCHSADHAACSQRRPTTDVGRRGPQESFRTVNTLSGKLLKFMFGAALVLVLSTATEAAELDGIGMPETMEMSGTHLMLNGLARRTYSFLRIRIYVAGLYLEHYSSDADAILASSQAKLLHFVFMRDIDAEAARRSWRESMDASCRPPCHLAAENVKRFLVPSVRKGETSTFFFTAQALDISMNGKLVGRITDMGFVRVILATFIGAHPTSDELKRGLLREAH